MSSKTEFTKSLGVLEYLLKNLPNALPVLSREESQYACLQENLDEEKCRTWGNLQRQTNILSFAFPMNPTFNWTHAF